MGNEMHNLCILEMENFPKLYYLPKEEHQIWVSTKPMITQAVFNAFSSGKDRCTRTLVITKCQNNIEQNKHLPKLRFSWGSVTYNKDDWQIKHDDRWDLFSVSW